MRELRNFRKGIAIISLDTTSPCRPSFTTMKAMQFNEDFSAPAMEEFQYHNFLFLN